MTEEKKFLRESDRKRMEYMIAWRERYIRTLEERLQGREEENLMLQTLLFHALCAAGERDGQGNARVSICKQEVTDSLGKWRCDAIDEGESYLVTFSPAAFKGAEEIRGSEKAE